MPSQKARLWFLEAWRATAYTTHFQGRPERPRDQLDRPMKKTQRLHVDKILIELLRRQPDTPFSNTSIRDMYLLQIPEVQRPSRNQVRKHIYRELLRLEKAKVIDRYEGSTGRGCKFIYRSNNQDVSLEAKPSPFRAAYGTLNRRWMVIHSGRCRRTFLKGRSN